MSWVPVAPFREAALRRVTQGEISWCELARRFYPDQEPHASGIKRFLGLEWYYPRPGIRAHRVYIQYRTAVRLCEILNLDPFEMDV